MACPGQLLEAQKIIDKVKDDLPTLPKGGDAYYQPNRV